MTMTWLGQLWLHVILCNNLQDKNINVTIQTYLQSVAS